MVYLLFFVVNLSIATEIDKFVKKINMRILLNESVGVVVDMQEKLLPHMRKQPAVLENTVRLIEGLKILGVEILVTQQYTKGLGETVEHIRSCFDEFKYIEKRSFSCYDEPSFVAALNNTGCKFVIVAGIETHVCVLQTVVDMVDAGFVPVVVKDCISSRKDDDKEIAFERMREEGAIITTVESVLFELTRSSEDPGFKQISKLIK